MKSFFNFLINISILLLVMLTAVPKSYFHDSQNHHHQLSPEEHHHSKGKSELAAENNCSFEQYDYTFSYLLFDIFEVSPQLVDLASKKHFSSPSFFSPSSFFHPELRGPPVF